jgi:DNA polymerase III epsilon subunit-like protein
MINPLPDFICSVLIARCMFPDMKSHALGCLASRLGIPFAPGAHRAAVDATVTANVLIRACDVIRTRFAVPRVDASVLRRIARATEMQEHGSAATAAA